MHNAILVIVFFSLGVIFHALYAENLTVNEANDTNLTAMIKNSDLSTPAIPSKSNTVISPIVDLSPLVIKKENLCKSEKQEISKLRNQLTLFKNLEAIEGSSANLEETKYREFAQSVADDSVVKYFERRKKNQDYGPYDQVISSPKYKELYIETLIKMYSPRELMMQQKYQESEYIQNIVRKKREFLQSLTKDERYRKLQKQAVSEYSGSFSAKN